MKFLDLFRKYIDHYSNAKVLSERREPVTIQAYNNKYSLVNAFLYEHKKTKLRASSFSTSTANHLLEWCSSKYSNNYSIRIVEICKDVLDFGLSQSLIKTHNLPLLKLKRSQPKAPIHLTPKELSDLENYLNNDERRQRARDMFLVQCYTGLAFIDMCLLVRSDLVTYKGRRFIFKRRKKTKKDSYIPVNDKLEGILLKYDFRMKQLSNAEYNAELKFIASDLKINKHLTTHVGRKTFAMICLNWEGYSMEATSRMLGVTTRTAEKHYAQVNINLISNEMDRLGF